MIILCGNKKDLDEQRQVTYVEAERFAQEHGRIIGLLNFEWNFDWKSLDLCFFETSAYTNENIIESFQQCARHILHKIESG